MSRKNFATPSSPEELFPIRDFEHGLGTLPMNCSVPAARPRLGQSDLSEAQRQVRRLSGSELAAG